MAAPLVAAYFEGLHLLWYQEGWLQQNLSPQVTGITFRYCVSSFASSLSIAAAVWTATVLYGTPLVGGVSCMLAKALQNGSTIHDALRLSRTLLPLRKQQRQRVMVPLAAALTPSMIMLALLISAYKSMPHINIVGSACMPGGFVCDGIESGNIEHVFTSHLTLRNIGGTKG